MESIEKFVAQGTLKGHELFMSTDNSTAKGTSFKGTSLSEKLFDLVLRLRKIEMEGEWVFHLIHVAGATQMIWSGGDTLSRGDHNAGMMTGEDMLSFILLAKSASERADDLLSWIHSWDGDAGIIDRKCQWFLLQNGVVCTLKEEPMSGCRLWRRLQLLLNSWARPYILSGPIQHTLCLMTAN